MKNKLFDAKKIAGYPGYLKNEGNFLPVFRLANIMQLLKSVKKTQTIIAG